MTDKRSDMARPSERVPERPKSAWKKPVLTVVPVSESQIRAGRGGDATLGGS